MAKGDRAVTGRKGQTAGGGDPSVRPPRPKERLLRIQYVVSDGDGRSVKWDERKAGDYSAAAAAFMAVAMGGDGFRRAVVRMAEDEFVGITGLLDGETGELIGAAVDAPEAKAPDGWGPFGPGPKGLRPRANPPSVDEWTAQDENAVEVVADLYRRGTGPNRSVREAVDRAVWRQTRNPMVSRCEPLEVLDGDTRVRLRVWREEDRLYEPDPEATDG